MNYTDPWESEQQQQSPAMQMTSYSIGRTALRFCSISGISFTVAVMAQSVPSSFAWTLLGTGVLSWLTVICAAVIKKGDDSLAMVGVTAFGMLGALVGVGEIISNIQWSAFGPATFAGLAILVILVMIERFITQQQQNKVKRDRQGGGFYDTY